MKANSGRGNSLMRGFAITLGGGLAVGLGIKIGQNSGPPIPPVEDFDFDPLLDRLEGFENRIVSVETALREPAPMVIPSLKKLEGQVQSHTNEVASLRAAIQNAMEERDSRIDSLGHAVCSLESRIPDLINQAIEPKFKELNNRVHEEVQETASQTLQTFADQIQSRVLEKIASIEGDLGRQSEAIHGLRDSSVKTDQNLQRLLAGVESLAEKVNRSIEAASVEEQKVPEPTPATVAHPRENITPPVESHDPILLKSSPRGAFPSPTPNPLPGSAREELPIDQPRRSGSRRVALTGSGLAAMVVFGVELSGLVEKPSLMSKAANAHEQEGGRTASTRDHFATNQPVDQSGLLEQARNFSQKREYSKADDIYSVILQSDPANAEVKRLHASALFRQEKIEESVKVLNSISEAKQNLPEGTETQK